MVAKKFNVSPTTIQSWIERTVKGELNLKLEVEDNRWKIKNNVHNQKKLFELSRKAGRFDRMKERRVEYTVDNRLYEIFTPKQVKLLARSIQDDSSLPLKYVYIGEEGAKRWYTFHEASTKHSYGQYLEGHDFFLEVHLKFILEKFKDKEKGIPKINVVDLGCGTADYSIMFIQKLEELGLLNAFLAIDISQAILDKLGRRFKEKDFKHIPFYSMQADMDEGLPFDFLFDHSNNSEGRIPALYLNFGGQISNNEVKEKLLIRILKLMNS